MSLRVPIERELNREINSAGYLLQKFTITDSNIARVHAGYTNVDAYNAVNLAYAHARFYNGFSQTVSIIGSKGFHKDWEEFKSKTIKSHVPLTGSAAGTIDGFAAILAGSGKNGAVKGVAFDAALHVGEFDEAPGDPNKYPLGDGLADVIRDARANGSVVSLTTIQKLALDRLSYSDVLKQIASNPKKSLAENWASSSFRLISSSSLRGKYISHFDDFIDAISYFTTQGVWVLPGYEFDKGKGINFIAGLPMQVKALKETSLVVASALQKNDASGKLASMKLYDNGSKYNAGCFQAASYCLSAPASVYTLRNYRMPSQPVEHVQSTNFINGAAITAGGVALVTRAFPKLRTSEIVDRLLASANNRFDTFKKAGTTTFANGFKHDYSEEFGHGLLDLKAALEPIGSIGLPVKTKVSEGIRSVSEFGLTYSTAVSPSINKALSNIKFTVFDSLGAPFVSSGEALMQSQGAQLSNQLEGLTSETSHERAGTAASFAGFSFSRQNAPIKVKDWQLGFGSTKQITGSLGFVAAPVQAVNNATSVMGLADGGLAVGAVKRDDQFSYGLMSFMDAQEAQKEKLGLGASAAYNFDNGAKLSLGVSAMRENGSYLGLGFANSNKHTEQYAAFTSTVNAGFQLPLADMSLFANAELGLAQGQAAGLITDIESSVLTGFTLGASMTDVALGNDRLTFTLSQPLHLETGSMTLRLPNDRNKDGTVLYKSQTVDFTKAVRQWDMGFEYQAQLSDATQWRFGGALEINDNGRAGETGATIMSAITHRF